jgi:hypothetical protein
LCKHPCLQGTNLRELKFPKLQRTTGEAAIPARKENARILLRTCREPPASWETYCLSRVSLRLYRSSDRRAGFPAALERVNSTIQIALDKVNVLILKIPSLG